MGQSIPAWTPDVLGRYTRYVASQHGEDGILEEIFRRIGVTNSFCVEFGAWDGKHLSNTWNLWHNLNWSALLIEGNPERFRRLTEEVKSLKRVQTANAFVRTQGSDSLDNILARFNAPSSPDLLSIDIDGDDYYVFQSLSNYTPRVVVVEYNPTVPPELDLIQNPGDCFGSSASAIVKLAHMKGYLLACCTMTNCILVKASDFPGLKFVEPTVAEVFDRSKLNYLVEAYDGTMFITRRPYYSTLRKFSPLRVFRKLASHLIRRKFRAGSQSGGGELLQRVRMFRDDS